MQEYPFSGQKPLREAEDSPAAESTAGPAAEAADDLDQTSVRGADKAGMVITGPEGAAEDGSAERRQGSTPSSQQGGGSTAKRRRHHQHPLWDVHVRGSIQ